MRHYRWLLILLLLSGGAWAQAPADSNEVHRPNRRYMSYFGSDFSSFFVETEWMAGFDDVAAGINFTYLPERWGAYASALFGLRYDYLSVGAALRLNDNGSEFDYHMYAGLMVSHRLGGEVGLRFAEVPRGGRQFCWNSASVGLAYINDGWYFTAGLSLELTAIAAGSIFLFFW